MFIRTKKIKGKEYAYIVENCLSNGKVKQRVKQYIGKVYRFERKEGDYEFFKFYSIQDVETYMNNPKERILADLIRFELLCYGFEEREGIMTNSECVVDLNDFSVRNLRKKNVAIALNNGLLSGVTLRRILDYEEEGVGNNCGALLAKYFIEAGIAVPKELFIAYFEKFYKPKQSI